MTYAELYNVAAALIEKGGIKTYTPEIRKEIAVIQGKNQQ